MGGFDDGDNRQVLNFNKITDGSTKTIMLAEMRVGVGPRDRRGVWAMGMCGSNMHCRHAGYPINDCAGYNDDIYKPDEILADVGGMPAASCRMHGYRHQRECQWPIDRCAVATRAAPMSRWRTPASVSWAISSIKAQSASLALRSKSLKLILPSSDCGSG